MDNGTDKDVYIATCTQAGTILTPPSLVGRRPGRPSDRCACQRHLRGQLAEPGQHHPHDRGVRCVRPRQHGPTNIHLTSGGTAASMAENRAGGHVVATVAADDDGDASGPRYARTDGTLEIDAVTGQIRVKSGAVLDYETTPSYTLAVTVKDQDGTGLSATQAITIRIDDVAEVVTGSTAARATLCWPVEQAGTFSCSTRLWGRAPPPRTRTRR